MQQDPPSKLLAHAHEPLPSTLYNLEHHGKRKLEDGAGEGAQRAEGQPPSGHAPSSEAKAGGPAAQGSGDHLGASMDRMALAHLINEAMPIDRALQSGHAPASHRGRPRGQLTYPPWMYDHTIDLTLELPGITVRQVRAELARDLWRRAREHYNTRNPTDQQLHEFVGTGRLGIQHKKQKTDESGQQADEEEEDDEEERRTTPLSGLLPTDSTLRRWMADAPYHLSRRPPLLALENSQPNIQLRQAFLREATELWKTQPPHEVITIDERSLVLYPTVHGMRVKDCSSLFMRHPVVPRLAQAGLPPNAVEPLPFELAPNLWRQPLSSIITSIDHHDISRDMTAAVPEPGEHLQHRRHVLHVTMAMSRSRVVMAMTQLRPFTGEDSQIFVQHLLRELDAQEDPQHHKRIWFVWNSATMQPSVRRLFPTDGSRRLLELPPHSPFLNMCEDAWAFVSSLVAQHAEQNKGHISATVLNEYVKRALSVAHPAQLHNWWEKVLCFVSDGLQGHAIDSHRPVDIPADRLQTVPAPAALHPHPWPILSLTLYTPQVERELAFA